MKHIYIVRKYVEAKNAKDAIKKEKLVPVHDCWLTDESSKALQEELSTKKPVDLKK
jgi:hypothetical protein